MNTDNGFSYQHIDVPSYFPFNSFPEMLQYAAIAVQKTSQAPLELVANTLLEALAAAYQGSFDIEGINRKPLPISIYTLAVAMSGEGKSTTQSIIFDPVIKFSHEMDQKYSQDMDDWRTLQELWEKELNVLTKQRTKITNKGSDKSQIDAAIECHLANKPTRPKMSRQVSTDATPAGLINFLHNSNGVGTILNSDAGQLINGPLVSGASLLCDLWSGSPITVDRGNACISIPAPRVSIALKVQPPFFRELLDRNGDDFRGSGLGGRFLAYVPESRIGRRTLGEELSEEERGALSEFHTRLYDFLKTSRDNHGSRRLIRLSDDARNFLRNIASAIERDMAPGGRLCYHTEFATKIIEHASRLAALFAIFEDPHVDELPLVYAQRAAHLMEYFTWQYAQMHSPYQGPGRDVSLANELLALLCQRFDMGQAVVSRSWILQCGPKNLRKRSALDRAVEIAISWQRIAAHSTPGKRAGSIHVMYQPTQRIPIPMPLL